MPSSAQVDGPVTYPVVDLGGFERRRLATVARMAMWSSFDPERSPDVLGAIR